MQISGVVDRARLVRNLQATLAHSEMHSIHVDETWEGLLFGWLSNVCVLVLVDWNLDFNFLSSSFSDGLDEAAEPRMGVDSLIMNKLRL